MAIILSKYFSAKNAKRQSFAFPKPTTDYIFAYGNAYNFIKLNQTCKFVFAKFQMFPMESLEHSRISFKHFKNYNVITYDEKDFENLPNKILLSFRLVLINASSVLYKGLMPKILQSYVKQVIIENSANLNFDDLKFLTESGRVSYLRVIGTKIIKKDSTEAALEEIMGCVLNVIYIFREPCHITSETMPKICAQNRSRKIRLLNLEKIDNFLDPLLFIRFLQEKADENVLKCKQNLVLHFSKSENASSFKKTFLPFLNQYRNPSPLNINGCRNGYF